MACLGHDHLPPICGLVAQWIVHRSPKPVMQVRFPPGPLLSFPFLGGSAYFAASGMTPRSLHDFTLPDLERRFAESGVGPTHARDLFKHLHRSLSTSLSEQTTFLPPLQRWVSANCTSENLPLDVPEVVNETISTDGRTRKYLLKMDDGNAVETVLMGYPGRFTACLSTQVGCAMGCVFCATGQMGFTRHLRVGEIVAQVLHVQRELNRLNGDKLRNLVLMGMGEPLHNFDAVMQALSILTDSRGLGIAPSKISISTVGHVPGIRKLAAQPQRYHLAVSLHGATDEERSALIPVNKRWTLAELLDACRDYSAITGEKVFIAWTMIAGKNDTTEHAKKLSDILRGMKVQVNLIPLNRTDGYTGATTDERTVEEFQRILLAANIPTTIRQRRGIDVDAGCGQLSMRQERLA
jgi:23S rRNA (adenine2503-C2)-methyltransferase